MSLVRANFMFINQFMFLAIKLRKCFTEFMALHDKFAYMTIYTCIHELKITKVNICNALEEDR